MTDIQIFNRAGELVVSPENMPDDPALRERFSVLRQAYDQCKAAEAGLEEAKNTLASCVGQVSAAEQYIKLHYPNRGEAGRISDVKAMIASTRREKFGV